MTDIRIEVELRHPVSRVWLALTEPRLLGQWFAETQPALAAGVRFRMQPVELPALEARLTGDVLEFDEPRRLVLRWAGTERRTVVAYGLTATPDGCRLAFLEFPEAGTWSPEERDNRETAYQQCLVGRLPAVLDWLAFREVEFAAMPEPGADPGSASGPATAPPPGSRPTRRRLALLGACLLVPAVGATVVLTGADGGGQVSSSAPAGSPSGVVSTTPPATTPGRPSARAVRPVPTPTPSATPSATGSSGRPTPTGAVASRAADRPAVKATYDTVASRLFGYTAEVVVANEGSASAGSWTVTIRLPDGASVATASGAQFRQDGREVSFTGPAVAAGAAVRFEFDVVDARLGPKRPTGCTIDGEPCAGL